LDCLDCQNCRDCRYCWNCWDWKDNPERIVSKPIGSRKDQTTVYFSPEKTQVFCGCFRGTLEEFKQKVAETYDEKNIFRAEYDSFIRKVENYIGKEE